MLFFVSFNMFSLTKHLIGAVCCRLHHGVVNHFIEVISPGWCSVKCLSKGFQPHCLTGFKLYERKLYVEKCRTTCKETGGFYYCMTSSLFSLHLKSKKLLQLQMQPLSFLYSHKESIELIHVSLAN